MGSVRDQNILLIRRSDCQAPSGHTPRRALKLAQTASDRGRSSRRAHDDLPSGVALFQIADCRGNFGERIAPVNRGLGH
jgi:hypothetical protein